MRGLLSYQLACSSGAQQARVVVALPGFLCVAPFGLQSCVIQSCVIQFCVIQSCVIQSCLIRGLRGSWIRDLSGQGDGVLCSAISLRPLNAPLAPMSLFVLGGVRPERRQVWWGLCVFVFSSVRLSLLALRLPLAFGLVGVIGPPRPRTS